jgi:2-dehydro-3-deoxyphosphogluconate aldolase / (4S)-4-hydroxy-2-oxoglutarate aldolase
MSSLLTSLTGIGVLPVVTIHDADCALPLVAALQRGGVRAVEITLRTPAALAAIAQVAKHMPDFPVAAGTVLNADDLAASAQAGAKFAVSPGLTPKLLAAASSAALPLLPGIATAGEIMLGLEAGYRFFKFFPATAAGGIETLKGFAGPFAGVRFCPTGGIHAQSAGHFLALENVVCVGGSWLTPADAVQARDWQRIETLARTAQQLPRRRG